MPDREALELVQKCLDDWPYAATRVVDIMTRLEKVKELLKEQEANLYKCPNCGTWVSAENVVRCKDCKHRDPEDHKCDCGHDIQWQLPRPDNWFCADGKPKDAE